MAGRLVTVFALISLTFGTPSPASAVIINSNDGAGNTNAPDGDCGWSYVGGVNYASCVYLGNGWVVTASHAGTDSVMFGTATYSAVPGSSHRLTTTYVTDSGTIATTAADLMMFQLQQAPSLSALTIASGTYDANEVFTFIGNGRNRGADLTYWNSSWGTTDVSSAVYTGYPWATGRNKRWGTNTLADTASSLVDDGNGITYCLTTTFDAGGGANEMQAATGDSGGGVFVQNGSGQWTLVGIILAIDDASYNHSAAYYGSTTYFADVSAYTDQIGAIMAVPEPGALALLTIGAAAWLLWRRRAAR